MSQQYQEVVYVYEHQLLLRYWQTRTRCCGHIVAHDVSWVAQTGKNLLWTQNASEQNQKHFLCPGQKIVSATNVGGQTGKHLYQQQCIRNNVSSFARAFTSVPQESSSFGLTSFVSSSVQ